VRMNCLLVKNSRANEVKRVSSMCLQVRRRLPYSGVVLENQKVSTSYSKSTFGGSKGLFSCIWGHGVLRGGIECWKEDLKPAYRLDVI
jgi:hypothetical protein